MEERKVPKHVLTQIGDVLILSAFAALLLAFLLLGRAGLAAVVCGHVMLWAGFVLGVAGDSLAKRPFSWPRLVYLLLMGFALLIFGPVIRAAGY